MFEIHTRGDLRGNIQEAKENAEEKRETGNQQIAGCV